MKNLLLSILLFVPAMAFGQAGHWYDADNPGHGVQINRDTGHGHAFTWYLYRKDGSSAFLTAGQTCESFPCAISLHEPEAGFMGSGEFDLGPEVGLAELSFTEEGKLLVDYELVAWVEECRGATPGGIIFQRCIGEIEMTKLAE